MKIPKFQLILSDEDKTKYGVEAKKIDISSLEDEKIKKLLSSLTN